MKGQDLKKLLNALDLISFNAQSIKYTSMGEELMNTTDEGLFYQERQNVKTILLLL